MKIEVQSYTSIIAAKERVLKKMNRQKRRIHRQKEGQTNNRLLTGKKYPKYSLKTSTYLYKCSIFYRPCLWRKLSIEGKQENEEGKSAKKY
jgi:hypothetical protein